MPSESPLPQAMTPHLQPRGFHHVTAVGHRPRLDIQKKKLRVKWITGETSQKYSPGFPLDLPGKKSMTRAYLNSVDDFAAAGYERERVFLANNPICWMYDETMHLPQKYVDVGIGVFSCWWLVCLWWTNHANGAMQHQTNILKHMGTQKHKHKHRHRNKPTLTHTHTQKTSKNIVFDMTFSVSF